MGVDPILPPALAQLNARLFERPQRDDVDHVHSTGTQSRTPLWDARRKQKRRMIRSATSEFPTRN